MDKSTSNKKNVVDHSTLDVKGNLHIGDVTYIINEKTVTIPHLLTNNIPSNAMSSPSAKHLKIYYIYK